MHKRTIVFLGAFVLTGFGFSAWALVRAATVIAAPPDSGLQLAALPSPETEKQREARLIEGAKKDGKFVYWDSVVQKEFEFVFSKFRQRYPFIATELWRGADAQLHQKVTTEFKAGVNTFDIAGTEIHFLTELKKTGVMKKYDWPNTAGWLPEHRLGEGYWIPRIINCLVVTYNTNLVSAAEAPKKWDDLLDPKWKGAISTDTDGGEWVLMLWAAWGKEKTVNYLKNLAKNNVTLGAGAQARIEMVSAGAYKIDLRINLDRVFDFQKRGAPVEWARTDPILLRPSPIYIAERAPHPNAAMLFADWFTSLEGQQAYQDASGKFLPDPRVKSKVGEALKGQKTVLFPVELAVHGTEAESIWRELFFK
jgi:iron(III) transport system substrate-binding protein